MNSNTCLFDESLKKVYYIFAIAGFNISLEPKKIHDNRLNKLLFYFNIAYIFLHIVGAIVFIGCASIEESFTKLTYVTPCIGLGTLTIFKALPFISTNANALTALLRQIEKDAPNRDVHLKIMSQERDHLHRILKIVNVTNWAAIVVFSGMPLCITAYSYFVLNKIDLQLPLLVTYPFNQHEMKYWPWTYLSQLWTVSAGVIILLGADCFFYICCTYIRIQFLLLRHDIEAVIPFQSISHKFGATQEFRSKIAEIVSCHLQLIHAVNLLNIMNSKSTLLNFMSSSTLICLCGFNVMNPEDPFFVLSFIGFLTISLMQIFLLCYYGQITKTSSMELCESVYNSHWYQAEPEVVQQLHIIQMQAQKPCVITAYGFAEINLRLFTKVMSTAMSYFTLLNSFKESKFAE